MRGWNGMRFSRTTLGFSGNPSSSGGMHFPQKINLMEPNRVWRRPLPLSQSCSWSICWYEKQCPGNNFLLRIFLTLNSVFQRGSLCPTHIIPAQPCVLLSLHFSPAGPTPHHSQAPGAVTPPPIPAWVPLPGSAEIRPWQAALGECRVRTPGIRTAGSASLPARDQPRDGLPGPLRGWGWLGESLPSPFRPWGSRDT